MSLRRRTAIGLFASLTLAAAALARYLLRPAPATGPSAAVAAAPPARDVPLPAAADSDARLRSLLAGLTPRELFQTWLAQSDLLNRLTVVTVNLAEDASPRAQLAFLRPERAFTAVRTGSHLYMSPRAAARYDAFANVISSLDEKAVASAYRTLHPLFESAYHALGYPGRPLDGVVTQALQRIADAPVREEVQLTRAGNLYVFADPDLEALGPVEKQLLRMGARNTRLLQGEAREIASAIGLPLQNHAPLVGAP